MDPAQMDPVHRSCFTRIAGSAQRAVPKSVKHLYNKLMAPIGRKLGEIPASYIFPLISNSVKAKVFPLSNPPGWKDEVRLKERDIKQLEAKIYTTETKIAGLAHSPTRENLPNLRKVRSKPPRIKGSGKNRVKIAKAEEALLSDSIQKFKKKLEATKAENTYLKIRKNSEIASRFAGHAGWITSALVGISPQITSGLMDVTYFVPMELTLLAQDNLTDYIPNPTAFAVANCVQVVAIYTHFKSATGLPNSDETAKEIKKVRMRTFCWIASIIYTVAMHTTYQNLCKDFNANWLCTIKN